METWNGRTWTTQHPVETAVPNQGDVLEHVSCVNPTSCEAVGFSFNPSVQSNSDQTLAEMWNGNLWALQTTINP